AHALRRDGFGFGVLEGRQQQAGEYGDDGNHHQQLDQCESAVFRAFRVGLHGTASVFLWARLPSRQKLPGTSRLYPLRRFCQSGEFLMPDSREYPDTAVAERTVLASASVLPN